MAYAHPQLDGRSQSDPVHEVRFNVRVAPHLACPCLSRDHDLLSIPRAPTPHLVYEPTTI